MAQADWRRYYAIVWDEPFPLPRFYLSLEECRENFAYYRFEYWKSFGRALNNRKPLGIVRIKSKGDANFQRWLWERSM